MLAACTTHLLGDADRASLRDALEDDERAYEALDGGLTRAFIRASYCSDHAVLRRSGAAPEAGLIRCEVGP